MGWFESAIKFPVVFLALMTALLSGTGLMIINGHLGRYFISDYALISTKLIHTGAMLFLFLGLSVVIIFSSIDVHNTKAISFKDVLNFLTKPMMCTNAFLIWFSFPGNTPDLYPTYTIFKLYNINSYWLYGLMGCSIFAFGLGFSIHLSRKKKNVYKFNEYFYYFLQFISIVPFPIMIYNSNEYRSVFFLFSILSFVCFNFYYTLCSRNQRLEEGEIIESYSVFSGDSIVKKVIPLDNIYLICISIVMFLMFINSYSKAIYPILDEQYGGGKLISIQVITNDGEIIKGPLLHYDDKRYYLLGSNKLETQIIEISKIKTIQRQEL